MNIGPHAFAAAFFVAVGVSLIAKRHALLGFGPLDRFRNVPQSTRARLEAAARRLAETETLPTGLAGTCIGVLSVAFAPLVFLTDIPFDTVLAALVFSCALGLAATFVRFRATRKSFATSLAARSASAALSWHVWVIALALSLTPTLWLGVAPIGASLFALAGLTIVAVAYKTATLPSIAIGVDRDVEAFVDMRIRTTRVAVLCALAVVPAYVFELTTPGTLTPFMRVILVLVPLGLVSCNVRMQSRGRKTSRPEVARWAHGAR